MSFFYFIENTFRHPIQFTDACFLEKETRPQFRRYAWTLYTLISLALTLVGVLGEFLSLSPSTSVPQSVRIVADVIITLCVLYPVHFTLKWLFIKAIELSGASIERAKAGSIVLYQLVVTLLPMLCLQLLIITIKGGIFFSKQSILPTAFNGILFLILLSLRLLRVGYSCFLFYKITRKTTSSDPFKVSTWLILLCSMAGLVLIISAAFVAVAIYTSFADLRSIVHPEIVLKLKEFVTIRPL